MLVLVFLYQISEWKSSQAEVQGDVKDESCIVLLGRANGSENSATPYRDCCVVVFLVCLLDG